MKHKTETYTSTYVFSAVQQEEVKQIYQKYQPPEEGKLSSAEDEKMKCLRRLDKSVNRYGAAAALLTGSLGAVIHGIGISLIQRADIFVLGTIIAVVGVVLILFVYPVYRYAAKRRRKKIKPEILKLCKELMK